MGGALEQVGEQVVHAAVADRRASVAIVLLGGNDSNNMIVPYDDDAYAGYAKIRGALAIPREELLAVSSSRQNASFGFHPAMTEIQNLYRQGLLAVLANEGPLVRPVSKAQLANHHLIPPNLFLHTGGDQLKFIRPGVVMPRWAVDSQPPDPEGNGPQVFVFGGMSVLFPDRVSIEGPAENNGTMKAAMTAAKPLKGTVFPDNILGRQLLDVTRLLQVASGHGWGRPVFSVTFSGFDTHQDQLPRHAALLRTLSEAMGAFHNALGEIGMLHDVTTFTYTEFNRTLVPNQHMGTEHGWGGHQLIMGGSVSGSDIYGRFPSFAPGSNDIMDAAGILVPSTASVQYNATLAAWQGARLHAEDEVGTIEAFPNLNLDFVR
jgi:uncharacterized protein (DUF1501 family)